MMDCKKYVIDEKCSILEALRQLEELAHENILVLFIVDVNERVVGSLTSGDIRRGILKMGSLSFMVGDIMNRHFTFLIDGCVDIAKLRFIKERMLKIVPMLDNDGRLVKILNFQTKKSYLPIDAVLMAGGKGERLRPQTLTTPKPLLKVGDKAIIDYNVDNLLSYGIDNINVTVNYLAELIEQHFKGTNVRCVREGEFLGTMGSVKLVSNWSNDTILVMNSDLFTNVDIEDFFFHFKESDADMSIAAIPYSVNIPYGIFELSGEEIVGIREKPTINHYANAGIYLIKRSVLEMVERDKFLNATDLMQVIIDAGGKVTRFPLSGYWIDIGNPDDFKKAQDLAKHTHK